MAFLTPSHTNTPTPAHTQDATAQQKKKLMKHDVDSVMAELNHMRTQQASIAGKFHEMESQNTALWSEVLQLRQRHHQQQLQITKIMQFLKRLSNHYPSVAQVPQPQQDADMDADTLAHAPDRKRARLAIGTLPVVEEVKSEGDVEDMGVLPSVGSGLGAGVGVSAGVGDPSTTTTTTASTLPTFLEHLTPHHGLQHIEDRLHQTRQRLANGGMDPSVLAGIYNISEADAVAANLIPAPPQHTHTHAHARAFPAQQTLAQSSFAPRAIEAAAAARPPTIDLDLTSVSVCVCVCLVHSLTVTRTPHRGRTSGAKGTRVCCTRRLGTSWSTPLTRHTWTLCLWPRRHRHSCLLHPVRNTHTHHTHTHTLTHTAGDDDASTEASSVDALALQLQNEQ